ncbi:hypothetical protein ACVWYH_003055 [Bradyrhizobium sp. GM24.11]
MMTDAVGAASVGQHLLERTQEVAAEIIVLVEDADLGVRLHADDVPRQDACFGRIQRQPRHRPLELLRVIPLRRAGVEQQLRHALGVEIFVHGGLRRGAERAIEREHLFLLDEAPRRLDAFRRAVGVVHGEKLDLAPVDAALLVQHLEIGLADPPEHAVERAGAGMRHGLPDLDLGVAGARIVFLLGGPDIGRGQNGCGHGGERGGADIAPRRILRHRCSLSLLRALCWLHTTCRK